MIITIEQLKKLDACLEAQEYFIKEFPKGQTPDFDPSLLFQMLMLGSPWGKYFGWAVYHRIIPMWSMAELDLSRANLSGADLSGADLSGADLSGATLSGANLFRAALYGADLSGAALYGATLSGATLSGADLSGAKWDKYTIWPEGFKPNRKTER